MKGLSVARCDALSLITADHSPHVNGAAKCPGYFCVSGPSSTDARVCLFCSKTQTIEGKINRYSSFEFYARPHTSAHSCYSSFPSSSVSYFRYPSIMAMPDPLWQAHKRRSAEED